MNRDVLTVFRFELGTFLRSKGYRLTTVLICAILLLASFIPSLINMISGRESAPADAPSGPRQILLVDDKTETAGLNEALAAALPALEIRSGSKASLAEGVYGALEIADAKTYVLTMERQSMVDSTPERLENVLASFFRQASLRAAGVDAATIETALAAPTFNVEEIASAVGKTQTQSYATTYATMVILYMIVQIYGQIVSASVAAEKGNRTMEVLISSTKPVNLIVGKVFGVGLAGIAQMACFLTAATVGFKLNKEHLGAVAHIFQALDAPGEVLGRALLFAVLAYFTFAFLYSAAGSLVGRSEDVSRVAGIISFPLTIAFFISLYATVMPESSFVTVASFIPLLSPLVLFVRLSMLTVPLWQIILSLAVTLLTLFGIALLSSAIYRLGVLMYGNPPSLGKIIASLRAARRGDAVNQDTNG